MALTVQWLLLTALGLAQLKSTAALLPPAALSTLHTRHGVRGIGVGCGWSAGAAVAGQRRRCVKMLEDSATVDTEREKKREEAQRLQQMAAAAAAAALAAEERAKNIQSGAMQQLAMLSKAAKVESEKTRFRAEVEARAKEGARLSAQADEEEKTRGTTTFATELAGKARIEMRLADEAQRKLSALEGKSETAGVQLQTPREPPTVASVMDALKGVCLIPVTGTRTDLLRCTDDLDLLKMAGKLSVWNSAGADSLAAGSYRGGSSAAQVRAITGVADETNLDIPLGVSSYKALQYKNYASGGLMFVGGLGLIIAGAAENTGMVALGKVGPAIESFGYGALILNILAGFFSDQTSNWMSSRLFQFDVTGYRKRAVTCEAAHLLVAYICGLPLEAYSRQYVGYPLKSRPTGRAQIYSTRRGDPEVPPRKRPFGLPPWASLEDNDVDDDGIFANLDVMPIKNGYSSKEIDLLSLVLLAAPVAECMELGSSSNGAIVYQQLDTCMLMSQDCMAPSKMQAQARWGLVKSAGILKKNKNKLAAVVAALEREESLQEVIAAIETTRD